MFEGHTNVHTELARMAGEWEGTVRTWFEKDELADEQPVRGSMRSVLDGRFMLHEYETTLTGTPCKGLAFRRKVKRRRLWKRITGAYVTINGVCLSTAWAPTDYWR